MKKFRRSQWRQVLRLFSPRGPSLRVVREQVMSGSETIQWKLGTPATSKMVLVHVRILQHVPDCEEYPVWTGYFDGAEWRWADGSHVEDEVIEWAEMPVGSGVDHPEQLAS
jgi:hypothetical protein